MVKQLYNCISLCIIWIRINKNQCRKQNFGFLLKFQNCRYYNSRKLSCKFYWNYEKITNPIYLNEICILLNTYLHRYQNYTSLMIVHRQQPKLWCHNDRVSLSWKLGKCNVLERVSYARPLLCLSKGYMNHKCFCEPYL